MVNDTEELSEHLAEEFESLHGDPEYQLRANIDGILRDLAKRPLTAPDGRMAFERVRYLSNQAKRFAKPGKLYLDSKMVNEIWQNLSIAMGDLRKCRDEESQASLEELETKVRDLVHENKELRAKLEAKGNK